MYKVAITITKYIPNTPGPFSSKLNFLPFQGEKNCVLWRNREQRRTDIWAKGEKERDIDHTLARGLESKQAG